MCTASSLPYCSTASKPHTVSRSMPFCTASCEHVGGNLPDSNPDYITVNIPEPSWCQHPAKRSLPICHVDSWITNPTNEWIRACVNPGWQIVSFPLCTVKSHPSCERYDSQKTWTCAFPAVFHQQLFQKFLCSSKPCRQIQHTLQFTRCTNSKFQKQTCMPQITVNVQCMILKEGKKISK